MKEKWGEEQLNWYTTLSLDSAKHEIIKDLNEAICRIKNNDYDTAFRLIAGVKKWLLYYEEVLMNGG